MIDERFSPDAFACASEDVGALTALQALLQAEVDKLVVPAIAEAVDKLVQQLNRIGHALVLEEDRTDATGICYAHGSRTSSGLRLWLCFDGTSTVGYAGIDTPR